MFSALQTLLNVIVALYWSVVTLARWRL